MFWDDPLKFLVFKFVNALRGSSTGKISWTKSLVVVLLITFAAWVVIGAKLEGDRKLKEAEKAMRESHEIHEKIMRGER